MSPRPDPLPLLGWREWVALPRLGVRRVKAKIDTGARTSTIHAWDIEPFERDGVPMVRFRLHPKQRDTTIDILAEAPLHEMRSVRNSGGVEEQRPVVLTDVDLLGQRFEIELTLTSRDAMGFRMLLGRQAIRNRFAVDPGRSYCGGVPKKKTRRKKADGS